MNDNTDQFLSEGDGFDVFLGAKTSVLRNSRYGLRASPHSFSSNTRDVPSPVAVPVHNQLGRTMMANRPIHIVVFYNLDGKYRGLFP